MLAARPEVRRAGEVERAKGSGGDEADVDRLFEGGALIVGPHHGERCFLVRFQRTTHARVLGDSGGPLEPGDFLVAVGNHDVLDEIGRDWIALRGSEEAGIHWMGNNGIDGDEISPSDLVRDPDSGFADIIDHHPHPLRVTSTRAYPAQTSPLLVSRMARTQVVRFILMRVEIDTEPWPGFRLNGARCGSGL